MKTYYVILYRYAEYDDNFYEFESPKPYAVYEDREIARKKMLELNALAMRGMDIESYRSDGTMNNYMFNDLRPEMMQWAGWEDFVSAWDGSLMRYDRKRCVPEHVTPRQAEVLLQIFGECIQTYTLYMVTND